MDGFSHFLLLIKPFCIFEVKLSDFVSRVFYEGENIGYFFVGQNRP